jgi:hypothetical protein
MCYLLSPGWEQNVAAAPFGSALCALLFTRSRAFSVSAPSAMRVVYLYKSRLVLLSPAAAHGEARGGVGLSLCL